MLNGTMVYATAGLLAVVGILAVMATLLFRKDLRGSAFAAGGASLLLLGIATYVAYVEKVVDSDWITIVNHVVPWLCGGGGILIVVGAIVGFVRMKRDDDAHTVSEEAFGH